MLRFLKTTFRNFGKDKLFTGINILGLTLGTSCALLISMIARHDLRFDNFHDDAINIYRVNIQTARGDDTNYHPTTPGPTGPALVSDFSEVTDYTRINYFRSGLVQIGDQQFNEDEGVAIVQSSFFDLFNFKILSGDAKLLDQPNQVFISESWAKKYFGGDYQSAIGKQFELDRNLTVQVAGVMEDFPMYTDLPFEMLVSETSYDENELGISMWGRIELSLSTFIKVAPGTDVKALQAKLPEMLKENAGERMASFITLTLQPLNTIHFDERYGNYNNRTVPPRILWGLLIIAAVLLITACINFINLATANAIKRSKEVGIRKVLGVTRGELIRKFLGETSVITIISLLLAIPATILIQPNVERIIGFPFEFGVFSDPLIWASIAFIGITVILLSGFYPALFTSRFSASESLKSGFNSVKGGSALFRRGLVITQFVISQTLLIGLFVIQSQISYFVNAEMGFQKDGVLNIMLPQDKIDKSQTLKNELQKLTSVEQVSLANAAASSENIWMNGFRFEGAAPDEHHIAEMKMADVDYLDLYGFELLAGRNYFKNDTMSEILVNRAMAEEMGHSNPEDAIGKGVSFGRGADAIMIVGVIENFYTSSLYAEVGPTVITTDRSNYSMANVKIGMTDISGTLDQIEGEWNKIFPNDDFQFTFIEDRIKQYYEHEQQLSSIIMWFTIVALFIGAIGLYGMVTFVVNQRMKELGIRKVMGASFNQLFTVISKEFVYLVIGAFLLAAPTAWYLGSEWLDGYDNRIEMSPLVFVFALFASILVAFLAILHKSIFATRVNPIETLRNE